MVHYKNRSCEDLKGLLKGDEITYAVLFSILSGECCDIFTDHENFIVCYSTPPFPVWTWCKNTDKAADIARCIEENFPFEKGHYHIMSAELFESLKNSDYFNDAYISVDMLSYRLNDLKPVSKKCAGVIDKADYCDLSKLSRLFHDFELEAEGIDHDMSHCVRHIKEHIENGSLFTWRNGKNDIVAMAARTDSGDFSRISSVYTLPEHRRQGYAENLVYSLCEGALKDSLVPILYADGFYGASNNCYKKIGFVQIGRLYHIRKHCK